MAEVAGDSIIDWRNFNRLPMSPAPFIRRLQMKLVLTGAVAALAATFATAALAQAVTEGPGHRAKFNADANGRTLGSGKPRTDAAACI
jgi:hypothetical protein